MESLAMAAIEHSWYIRNRAVSTNIKASFSYLFGPPECRLFDKTNDTGIVKN